MFLGKGVSKFEVKVSKSLFVDQMNVCDLKSELSPCPRLTTVLCVQLSLLLATCRASCRILSPAVLNFRTGGDDLLILAGKVGSITEAIKIIGSL